MASNENKESDARGNEWEVVSLTASEYAAGDGLKGCEEYEAETSSALFMSRHFAFPPSTQLEYLQPQPGKSEILIEKAVERDEFVSTDGGGRIDEKTEEHLKSKEADFPGMHIFYETGDLAHGEAEVIGATTPEGSYWVDKEPKLYDTGAHSSSLQGEKNMFGGSIVLDESSATSNATLSESVPQQADISGFPNEKKHDGDDHLPCQAWWKRQSVSLIAHAKEANTFWSVFIAAAVMGLVIIGQCWQHERWLQLKWQNLGGVHDEKICRMVGPLSRIRNAIIGGDRRGSSIRGSASTQH
ncbi:unnamed protein product [Cuscuta epithymum]|uniref:ATG8-interacting protein 1 n=1 Tax=Cuscuta epithymum TaxID=186058 RepID=A0AAV0DC78_9ASTE|nr:unnamed protein product [Cuscuta epithymum]